MIASDAPPDIFVPDADVTVGLGQVAAVRRLPTGGSASPLLNPLPSLPPTR